MFKLVDYKWGILFVGEVILRLFVFVGNEYNGWRVEEVVFLDLDGWLWICFSQLIDLWDFRSFRLNEGSPRFVKETAKKLGV
jgi:hypothetical protein